MAPIRLRSVEQIEDELTVAFIEIRKLVEVGGMDYEAGPGGWYGLKIWFRLVLCIRNLV